MDRDVLTQVKDRLRITWAYQDDEIMELIEEAEAFIKSKVSIKNVKDNKNALKLLKEYCRYAWSGSSNQFGIDYSRDILNLQLEVAMREAKNDKEKL